MGLDEILLVDPRSVTVVGVSERLSAARELVVNLVSDASAFPGAVNLVNRGGKAVFGLPTVKSLADVEDPGLIFFLTSEAGIEEALQSVRSQPEGIVIYAERIHEERICQSLADWAHKSDVPVIGPQSSGVVAPYAGLIGWTGALPEPVLPGEVAVLSQSGGMLSGFLRRSAQSRVGIRLAISCGVGQFSSIVDLATRALNDPGVKLLALYAEALSASELSEIGVQAIRQGGKPVILLHPGASPEARNAMQSHVGQAATGQEILRGVSEQYGILVLSDPEELMLAIQASIATGYKLDIPSGIAVVSTSGGAGVVTTDAMSAVGISLPRLTDETRSVLSSLGGPKDVYNPYDFGAAILDRDSAAYSQVVAAIAADPEIGIIVETTGTGMSFGVPEIERGVGTGPRTYDRSKLLAEVVRENAKVGVVSTPYELENGGVSVRGSEGPLLSVTGAHRCAVVCRAISKLARVVATTTIAALPPSASVSDEVALSAGVWSNSQIVALLAELAVQWPEHRVVETMDQTIAAWLDIGPDIVAKTEAQLPHRSVEGGVIAVKTQSAVMAAVALLIEKFEAPVALYRSIEHTSEFLVGFTRKEGSDFLVFGPGGTDANKNLSLRICPCSEDFVRLWVEDVVGLSPEHRGTMVRLLMDLQSYAVNRPWVSSLELNPVMLTLEGQIYALDAKLFSVTSSGSVSFVESGT